MREFFIETLAARLAGGVASMLRRINPEGAIGEVRTMDEYIGSSLAPQRFALTLMTAFAGLAVVLCVVGIYGVFGYSVSRREQ
jgi:putative ABC transport system permease protein